MGMAGTATTIPFTTGEVGNCRDSNVCIPFITGNVGNGWDSNDRTLHDR